MAWINRFLGTEKPLPNDLDERILHNQQWMRDLIEKSSFDDWVPPWRPEFLGTPPFNPKNGECYQGINRFTLLAAKFIDPRWIPASEALSDGYEPKPGEAPVTLRRWEQDQDVKLKDLNGKPVLNGSGEEVIIQVFKAMPSCSNVQVYNYSQLLADGKELPPFHRPTKPPFEPHLVLESLMEACGAKIAHQPRLEARYNIDSDTIVLPPRYAVDSQASYYRLALHELCHWTGHPGRLERTVLNKIDSSYAREELVAELASFMIAQDLRLDIGESFRDHSAKYMSSYYGDLRGGSWAFARICADAEKIRSYHIGFVPGLEKKISDSLRWDSYRVGPDPAEPDFQSMVFDIVRPMLAAKMRKTAESAGGAARRPGEGAPGDPKPVGGGENPRPPSGMGASFGGGSGKGFQGYGLKENGSQGG